jgi:hypothetical protein
MYSSLTLYGQSSSADNKHYPCPNMPLPTYHVDEEPIPPKQTPLSFADARLNVSKVSFDLSPTLIPSKNKSIHHPVNRKVSLISSNHGKLLPVMDPRFNLREICKQCVLLEDHLTHDDKRCSDCCTKHFLTLEALAEEALTLDKQGLLNDDAKQLPHKIRELELMWIRNPSKCSEISQKLREIRKQFQEQTFSIIENGCDGGMCTVSA